MHRTGPAVLIVLLALAGLVADVGAADGGLVAEWHFDEGSGSVLHDSSGNGNDGVIHGATWVEGKVLGALSFDGRGDYVEVPDSPSLDITDAITIEAWVKFDSLNNQYQVLVKKGVTQAANYMLYVRDYNRLNFCANGITGTQQTAKFLEAGTWYHVCASIDNNGTELLVVDGSTILEYGDIIGTMTTEPTKPLYIGVNSCGRMHQYLIGTIDEVRIYNRALTADETKSHYELAGTTAQTPAATTSTSSVSILDYPSTIHGGEDVEVTVGWENIPSNWKLVVSLEKSETDKDRLADDVEKTISGTGKAVFKLNTHSVQERYDRALVWASLRDENDNWKGIYTNAVTTVLPAATQAPQIAATPEPSPAPTQKQDDGTTEMLKLAGGAIIALLAITLLAGKLRGKRRDVPEESPAPGETTSTPPPAPTIVADPAPQPPPPSAPTPRPATEPASIEIKRGYEVLWNNDLRFGIRIINPTDYAIMDVETLLDYDKNLFSLNGNRLINLANIHPHGERTATYLITPEACIHNEAIGATIIYKDHTGEKRTVQMREEEVHCVCPFLTGIAVTPGEFSELAAKSKYIDEGLSFSGISTSEIADFIKAACTHRLHTVGEHEIDNTIILYLAGESIGEKAHYLLTAVIHPYKDENIIQIAFRAYSDKSHGLHGFLNEITHSIRHLVGSVQSAKEIGVIENKQVVNIIDSVVSRTSFGDMGQGGSNEVNVKDSVMHRSGVGGGGEVGAK